MSERLTSLEAVEAAVWAQLVAAVAERAHAWHTPVLATTDGAMADARTVVLRGAEPAQHRLLTYSDARAPKVAQCLSHPSGMLVMWSPALSWQLRCRVQLSVEDGGLAVASRWATLQNSRAAQDYLSPLPPGAPISAPAPAASKRANFAIITAQVLSIDWLELHRDGHRRAVFGDGAARWVQP